MTHATDAARTILERCLFENDSAAWSHFLGRYRDPIRRAALGSGTGGPAVAEFADWFPGWLYEKRKLHALYRALLAKVESGACASAASEDEYVNNYLGDIVASAVSNWRSLHRPVPPRVPPVSDAPPEIRFADAMERLRAVLRGLPVELRVPFWIRYTRALGPLSATDAAWVGTIRGQSADEVTERIAREAAAQSDPDRPLGTRFISYLLGLPPLSTGKFAAADQRIRRARDRIRDALLSEE